MTSDLNIVYKLQVQLSSSQGHVVHKRDWEGTSNSYKGECDSDCETSTLQATVQDIASAMNQYYKELLHAPSCSQIINISNNSMSNEKRKEDSNAYKDMSTRTAKEPIVCNNVESIQLYQVTTINHISNHSNDEHGEILGERIQCSCKYKHPPLIAIVIPIDILIQIMDIKPTSSFIMSRSSSFFTTNSKDNENRIILSNILSQIHPSLTYLEPCGLFQCSFNDYDDETNSFDILLLKLNTFNDDETYENENERKVDIEQILEDINGQSMVMSPTSVIQAIPISDLSFTTTAANAFKINPDHKGKHSEEGLMLSSSSSPLSPSMSSSLSFSEIPLCPVCRFRIEPKRFFCNLNLPKPHQRCSSNHHQNDSKHNYSNHNNENVHANDICKNMQFLSPWEYPTYCRACHILQERLTISGARPFLASRISSSSKESKTNDNKNKLSCYKCAMKETLWLCLTCGTIGCGRYSHGHAEQHYKETNHPYSLELATQRIWSYIDDVGSSGSFVNRNDLLNCKYMQEILGAVNRAAYQQGASVLCSSSSIISCDDNLGGGQSGVEEYSNNVGESSTSTSLFYWSDGVTPKKAANVGEEYEVLLQSALEDQAQHFELEITHLAARLASESMDMTKMSAEQMEEVAMLEKEIADLRTDLDLLSREYVDIQAQEAGHRAKSNILLREQGVTKQLLDKIREEASREHRKGTQMIEELEQQITDLTANLKMRRKFAGNQEFNNAHIYGTSLDRQKSSKKKGFRRSRR